MEISGLKEGKEGSPIIGEANFDGVPVSCAWDSKEGVFALVVPGCSDRRALGTDRKKAQEAWQEVLRLAGEERRQLRDIFDSLQIPDTK